MASRSAAALELEYGELVWSGVSSVKSRSEMAAFLSSGLGLEESRVVDWLNDTTY